MEPTWNFLKQGSDQELRKRKWEIDYILLLWLSVILYIPFSLTTVVQSSTIEDLLQMGKSILASPAKTRDAAAEMLARLLTRPDMEAAPLDAFLNWADTSLVTSDPFLVHTYYILSPDMQTTNKFKQHLVRSTHVLYFVLFRGLVY